MKKRILSVILVAALMMSLSMAFTVNVSATASREELAARIIQGMAEKTYACEVPGSRYGYDNWVCNANGVVIGYTPGPTTYFTLSLVSLAEDGNNIKYSGHGGVANITFVFVGDAVVRIEIENTDPDYSSSFPTATLYPNKFNVIIDSNIQNGTVSVKGGGKVFTANTEVELEVTPDTDSEFKSLTYTPLGGEPVDITETKKFTMPSNFVTVTAVFEKVSLGTEYTVGKAAVGEDGKSVQAVTDDNLGTIRFGWQIFFDGEKPTSLGAVIIDWSDFGSKQLQTSNTEVSDITNEGIFYAELTDIPETAWDSTISAYPFVNGTAYEEAKIEGTVNNSIWWVKN